MATEGKGRNAKQGEARGSKGKQGKASKAMEDSESFFQPQINTIRPDSVWASLLDDPSKQPEVTLDIYV